MTNKTIPELIEQYHEAEEELHERFGFLKRWRAFPIDNLTELYWFDDGDRVYYSDVVFTEESIKDGHQLYTATLNDKHQKDGFTMILGDTESDGNIFLMIFDDLKELRDEDLIKSCVEEWG